MSDNDCAKSALRMLVVAWACTLGAISGCSTLDGGYQGQALKVKVAEREGVPRNASTASGVESTTVDPEATRFGASTAPATLDEIAYAKPDSLASGPSEAGQSASDQEVPERTYWKNISDTTTHAKAMATRYANLQPAACRAELRRRRIAAIPDHGLAPGIASPMRLTGPLRNVRFLTPGPKSVHGKLDCRLVLLLDELAGVLAELAVTSVHVDGFYRPKAHLPGKKSPSQHAFGLAIDMHAFGMDDGRTLLIERDFAGQIGLPVCGESVELQPDTRDAVMLRNIVCAIARTKAFHYLLTPNHDSSHRNHLHGDIKRGAREHLVR